jgi:hypothetical protein
VDEFIARHTVAPAGEQPRRVPTKRPGKRKAVESAEEVCGFGWDLLKSPS